MAAGRSLTLLAPALFAPLPGLAETLAGVPASQLPSLTALRTLVARGATRPGRELEEGLLAACGHPPDIGIAPLTRLADQGELPPGYCLRADPVHLVAGQHNLVLAAAGESLELEAEHAAAFIDSLNDLYAERGWHFEAPLPGRWYLHLPVPPAVETTPLAALMGQPVDDHLPRGPAVREWNGVLAEVQMALHGHPLNAERAAQGLPEVNSVWFWGGGEGVSTVSARAGHPVIWSDEPLAIGLSRYHGGGRRDRPEGGEAWLRAAEDGDHLLALAEGRYSARESPGAWLAHLEELDIDWFRPLLAALRSGHLRRLRLLGAAGGIEVTPARLHRLWRRPVSLARLAGG